MVIMYLKTDIHFEPLKIGGSISHMLGMLQGFQSCNASVILASSVDHEQLDALCVKKYNLSMPKFLRCLRWKINCILSSFFFLPLVLYLIYKHKPDYLYQRYSPFNFTGIFAQYLSNTPLILEYNGSEVWADKAWLKTSVCQRLLRPFMQWCEEKILTCSTYRSIVSCVLKDELINRYALCDKTYVTPNGVNTTLFSPAVQSQSIVCAPGSFIIGFSSSFGPWHGIEIIRYLITTFAERATNFHLVVIGTGALYQELLATTQNEHVSFLGRIPHGHMPSYLAACDAFICPTQPNSDGTPFFGSPTKLFEYASLAKPIITSNIAQTNALLPGLFHIDQCHQHLLIEHQAGICVEPTDKEGFFRACQLLQSLSAEQRALMGTNARNHVIKHYEWSSIAQGLIDSLKD